MNGSQTQETMACVLPHTHHKRRASRAGAQCPSMQQAILWAAARVARGLVDVSVSGDPAVLSSGESAVSHQAAFCAGDRQSREHGLFHDQVSLMLAKLMLAKLMLAKLMLAKDLAGKDLAGDTGNQSKAVSM